MISYPNSTGEENGIWLDDTRCFKSHERCEIEDDAFKHEAIIIL
jgi:hypothetical protein